MFDIYNDKNKKVHFIGIGGISMSGLAEILIDYGYHVSGSDRSKSKFTDKLQKLGADIFIGHEPSHVHGADLVVYTAAVKDDNPELIEAKNLDIPLMDRAEFLGAIMKKFSKGIAVSGTHGKTTVTSMISTVLLNADLDPTIMVGGELDAIDGNVKPGKSPYFITEACEYKGSFLKFYPYIGIILNIDADHLDYYKDIKEIHDTFFAFADLIPKDGLLIGCAEDDRVIDICKKVKCNTLTYGIKHGDFTAKDIVYDSKGFPSFTACYKGEDYGRFSLSVPGEHNVLNALSAIACSYFLGIDKDVTAASLKSFTGTHRRFEKKGEKNGVVVIDDYAHHPAEIIATIKAAKNYPHKRIFCVFQPHTYTRTYTLFEDFAKAFNGLDKLILTDIYAAREKDTGLVSSNKLCEAVKNYGVNAVHISSFKEIVEDLSNELKEGDLLITMGAGDVYLVGEDYLK
ncbi:UDP-N-acetylmuramate--alanine ligase [Fervidicella metallireducens AeB]|uniref:UDP-N-acetylmuramate--L-alanine ligase n=1 Tax=Fervidicella metallireducens AeB TaxID=1403537 RepID=A0A017RSZ8_9CLOT|nr:UDP-N-acetylmuramate--L-alanine ligase [Fervidicella metallireducens]EYE87888.1 UDP-N-acetylmuramate--alanine ligase [Fervidicella metallireducens AeB]